MSPTDADLLIVGGGIAGWSVAWHAARAGRRVTLIDDGLHRASDVPIALINPLRGARGRLVDGGVDGLAATFALIDRLRGDGHAIDGARGLFRPLVGIGGDAASEGYWRARLEGRLAFRFDACPPSSTRFVEPVPTLYLPDAGWVAPASLLGALRAASGATVVSARAVAVAPDRVRLADGRTVAARQVVWCGGAWGAAILEAAADPVAAGDGRRTAAEPSRATPYRPGSLAVASRPPTAVPLAFGLYAVPRPERDGGGVLVGPTREASTATFAIDGDEAAAVRHLQDRVAGVFAGTIALEPAWRGVRLAALPAAAASALVGVPSITALGSRGFLTAPLLAAALIRSL